MFFLMHTHKKCDFYTQTVESAFTSCLWVVYFIVFLQGFLKLFHHFNSQMHFFKRNYLYPVRCSVLRAVQMQLCDWLRSKTTWTWGMVDYSANYLNVSAQQFLNKYVTNVTLVSSFTEWWTFLSYIQSSSL